jgi:hypothetical protein
MAMTDNPVGDAVVRALYKQQLDRLKMVNCLALINPDGIATVDQEGSTVINSTVVHIMPSGVIYYTLRVGRNVVGGHHPGGIFPTTEPLLGSVRQLRAEQLIYYHMLVLGKLEENPRVFLEIFLGTDFHHNIHANLLTEVAVTPIITPIMIEI